MGVKRAETVEPVVDPVDEWRPSGAVLVAGLALLLLLLTLYSAYGVLADAAGDFMATTLAALVLPSILVATILTGVATGVVAVGRFANVDRIWSRLLSGALGGLPVGLLAMGGTVAAYHKGPAIPYVAVVVVLTGVLGGAVAAIRPISAAAAGAVGGVAVTAIGLIVAYFQNDLTDFFGNQETVGTMAIASARLQLTTSIVSGVIGGLVTYVYLRRTGLTLPWPAYLLAGAVPGLLTLAATLLGWVGRLPLVDFVRDRSVFDAQIIAGRLPEQINHGMIVFFAGAFTAMIAVGRTLRRSAQ
ncbi:hypothetical protein [Dactylosporangium fulvum]|uniref:Integral membrane protein n=1 Tax=Dactylosporangium fulvum TaxID=53359 RepID=A0ABY5VXA1_9ACTN|nr:hypothetical protein [Dactylosporangium fulvum]UWP81800.1 hypothetical protein Dfulv_43035 [Dactylosporangium fulvum]